MGSEVCVVLGTRPEIIKLAPVIRELERRDVPFVLVHTGQHYSEELDSVFFEQLDLPEVDHNLRVGSGSHAEQTASMLTGIESVVTDADVRTVLVQGDTNSVLAAGLVASKLDVELGHIEAGLRSFDRQMPEEINRRLVDHASDYLFAPTEAAERQLLDEGVSPERIHVTGNTIVDAVYEHRQFARSRGGVVDRFGLEPDEFALLTAHRAENVDTPEKFEGLLDGVAQFADETGLDVVYPIHPRARKRLDEFGLDRPEEIQFVDPLDYLDFLLLQTEAAIVFTDSGGVQEESCILGVPCVTLRENTERPETLDVGSNVLAGTDPETIHERGTEMLGREPTWENPFGDGDAAQRIVDVIWRET